MLNENVADQLCQPHQLSRLSKLTLSQQATIFRFMDVLPPAQKPRSKAKPGEAAEFYAYELSDSAAKDLLVETPPSGVKVAFVATSQAAEKELKAWAPKGMKPVGRFTASKRRRLASARSEIESSAFAPSSRARALLQGVKIAEADLKDAGGAYDLEEVQTLLNGVSRQALEKRVRDGSLLAVPGPSNRRRYPTLQFTREGLVSGLREVQNALPTRNPWAVLNFLVRPDDRLGRRKPIEVLRDGNVDLVVSAARGMGVQGV